MTNPPRYWIVRGNVPPDAAIRIRQAMTDFNGSQRIIFDDWDIIDPAVFSEEERAGMASIDWSDAPFPSSPITMHMIGPETDTEFCDWSDLDDDKECDSRFLWSIRQDDALVGYVCAAHKGAYVGHRARIAGLLVEDLWIPYSADAAIGRCRACGDDGVSRSDIEDFIS